ncbi:hypothetical protein EOD41_09660 [Mucilaginibacter limnophilus]|uniref:Uncharacterized protein n=1 Tax=Mucilaginibacter limnophilus TaxID=1932778 RepID=A0A437MTB6_9SPHI|nr:hypothetical protein [Mucilaginibacter limnophilus]RVU00891.1 hypothetical protein EOD41_09660 [Mucilaginibacter limnophilus]
MRRFVPVIIVLMLLGLSSCVDIEERYTFRADGSCRVVYGFDMSRAVSVLKNLMTDSVQATPEFSITKDTSLNFYSAIPDSIQRNMSAEDVQLAKTSDLSVKMDLRKSLMKVNVSHVAKNAADLEYYLKNISKISMNSQLSAIAKNPTKKGDIDSQSLMAGQDYYTYEITPTRFRRIVDKVKFNAFLKKTQSTLIMAKAMLIDMPYKVVLNFAKPVKKVNNSKAVLSADRKSVTLITDMDEIIKNPAIMNLQVDF